MRNTPYGARDEAYVDAVLARVRVLWLKHPGYRLGQLLDYARPHGVDPFYMRDEDIT